MKVLAIDHVQLAMPAGQEDLARKFYSGLLELPETPKPAHLAARGGCWFEAGAVKLHLGVEMDFRPGRKAHPALVVEGFEALLRSCTAAGHPVVWDAPLDGHRRAFVSDPFGNRIELIETAGDIPGDPAL